MDAARGADVQEERAEIEFTPVTHIGFRVRGDLSKIKEAAALLATARNPAIIAGDGCARSGALAQLAKLAETIARYFETRAFPSSVSRGLATEYFSPAEHAKKFVAFWQQAVEA